MVGVSGNGLVFLCLVMCEGAQTWGSQDATSALIL
jgi:hypothetical protein